MSIFIESSRDSGEFHFLPTLHAYWEDDEDGRLLTFYIGWFNIMIGYSFLIQ